MAETIDRSLNTTHIEDSYKNPNHILYDHYEAARSSFFVFQVAPDQFQNLLKPDYDQSSGGEPTDANKYKGTDFADYLRLNVVKASVPNFTVTTHEYRRGNDVVKFAGTPEFKEGSLTVDDVVGLRIKDMLYAWLYLAYDPHTRKGGRMADYKKTCTLLEYTQDYKLIRYWELQGCFITGIEEGDFDRESDEKRQLSISISYDRAMMYPNHDTI